MTFVSLVCGYLLSAFFPPAFFLPFEMEEDLVTWIFLLEIHVYVASYCVTSVVKLLIGFQEYPAELFRIVFSLYLSHDWILLK